MFKKFLYSLLGVVLGGLLSLVILIMKLDYLYIVLFLLLGFVTLLINYRVTLWFVLVSLIITILYKDEIVLGIATLSVFLLIGIFIIRHEGKSPQSIKENEKDEILKKLTAQISKKIADEQLGKQKSAQ